MKKLLLLALLSVNLLIAQQRDPRADMFNFVPGQIIVKLKDHVDAKVTYNKQGVGTTKTNIGKLLGIQDKVVKTAVLFDERSVRESVERKQSQRRDPRVPEPHTLKNTFVLDLTDKQENIMRLVEELSKNAQVEYAEPNYNYSINDFTINSDIITEKDLPNYLSKSSSTAPNDVLYPQQTNITQTKIDKVWEKYTTGNGSQIIAILDTGVDYTHPDLAANI